MDATAADAKTAEQRFVQRFSTAGRATAAALAEPREKFERRISRAKSKEYPRRSPEAWTKAGYARSGLVERLSQTAPDDIERVDAEAISEAQFADTYERGSRPVIVRGLTSSWPAVCEGRWSLESLLVEYGQDRFKVGEDDDGYAVYVKLKHFVRYCLETADDSPLVPTRPPNRVSFLRRRGLARSSRLVWQYVFDSSFAEREATRSLRHDWALPRFFTDDLFKLVGERRRPPYRWLVLVRVAALPTAAADRCRPVQHAVAPRSVHSLRCPIVHRAPSAPARTSTLTLSAPLHGMLCSRGASCGRSSRPARPKRSCSRQGTRAGARPSRGLRTSTRSWLQPPIPPTGRWLGSSAPARPCLCRAAGA
jgi:hypothetical protein